MPCAVVLSAVERNAVTLAGHVQRATAGAVPQSVPNPLCVKRHDGSRWPPRTPSLQPVEVFRGIMCKEDNPIVLCDKVLEDAVEKHLQVSLFLNILRLIEREWDQLAEAFAVLDNDVASLDNWSLLVAMSLKLDVGQAELNHASAVVGIIAKLGINSHKRNVRSCASFPGK
jgi:hypothetical protein